MFSHYSYDYINKFLAKNLRYKVVEIELLTKEYIIHFFKLKSIALHRYLRRRGASSVASGVASRVRGTFFLLMERLRGACSGPRHRTCKHTRQCMMMYNIEMWRVKSSGANAGAGAGTCSGHHYFTRISR